MVSSSGCAKTATSVCTPVEGEGAVRTAGAQAIVVTAARRAKRSMGPSGWTATESGSAAGKLRVRHGMPRHQIDLFGATPRYPEGFRYQAELIDAATEARMLD